jgi:hypothetical protein
MRKNAPDCSAMQPTSRDFDRYRHISGKWIIDRTYIKNSQVERAQAAACHCD